MIMAGDLEPRTHGFPSGYFVIRSVATDRLWDVGADQIEDGTEIILWPEKDNSLVEGMRRPESDNQVFFVDTSGALCSRSSGHAIDIEDGRLVLRHRRPVSQPYPNAYSHPLPLFSYSPETSQISVNFSADPSYPPNPLASTGWKDRVYVLTSIPLRKPRTFVNDASDFLTTAISTPFSFLIGGSPPKATPEDVFNGNIDLAEDEILEEDRTEEGELDDSPEGTRRLRCLSLHKEDLFSAGDKAMARRQFDVIPLRTSKAHRQGA
ncbi:hypothetical protein PLICRDRAFT_132413 [Plicaturopsis crispa FD-325 SS-3]|nr:hypothetical protein PLICRDRAFT_132413 [Plicaturopsis crispa FD-325 SS-3]